MPCLSTDVPQPTPALEGLSHPQIINMCVCCLLFVYVCLCVCMFVCVFACVDLGAFNPPPHVYPSGNGLVPTRSGGCTPRVWAHLAARILRGMLTQPYAPVTIASSATNLSSTNLFPLIVVPLPCAPRTRRADGSTRQ